MQATHPRLVRLGTRAAVTAVVASALVAGGASSSRTSGAHHGLLGPQGLVEAAFSGTATMYLRYGGVTTGTGTGHSGDASITRFTFGASRSTGSPTGNYVERES